MGRATNRGIRSPFQGQATHSNKVTPTGQATVRTRCPSQGRATSSVGPARHCPLSSLACTAPSPPFFYVG
eukprot:1152281-Pelagomonas_calceolata.AAC.2